MILHIGEGYTLPIKSVIAIIDVAKAKNTVNDEFLTSCIQKGNVVIIHNAIKSYILSDENNIIKVYYSPISSSALHKQVSKALKI